MYMGFASKSSEWVRGTDAFLEHAFGSKCKNNKKKRKRAVGVDIHNNGFVPIY
jgi:hypothetical protein